jgi:hypothetical protein
MPEKSADGKQKNADLADRKRKHKDSDVARPYPPEAYIDKSEADYRILSSIIIVVVIAIVVMGLAWCRVSFVVPKELEGKEVWLIFGGVADYCRVFFEGRGGLNWHPGNVPLPVKEQEGPRVNITKLVDYGKENTMLMWVNNIQGPGGIWKPVKLAVKREAP